MGTPNKEAEPPHFRLMSIMAKRLDGSRWHLACRWASAQATLCYMRIQLPKRGTAPSNFRPMSRPHVTCARWGPSPPKKTGNTPISTHVYCDQTAGWVKMALGMKAGLGPGQIVLDGDPAPLPRKGGTAPPQFSTHVYSGQTVAHFSYCWLLLRTCS